jgi:radical SAM-linked protein
MTDEARYRWRLTYAKKQLLKYIAHLDLMLAWERALRRAQIPLAYSQGFNPRPKIQAASGLPVGTSGAAEIIDIITTAPLDPTDALARIRAALPVGIELHALEAAPLKTPALQQLLRQANYRVQVETELPPAELTRRIEALLAAGQLVQSRVRRQQAEEVDLRPWLHELRLETLAGGVAHVHMRLTAGQFGNLRPEAILDALGLGDHWAEIERTRLIFEPPAKI